MSGISAENSAIAMRYSVADISVPLDSVSQICDSGAKVTFHRTGGYIEGVDGKRSHFIRDGDTYVRQVWIKKPDVEGASFSRPRDS